MASLETTLVNSIVGSGTYFKGTITVSGLLRIDGDLSGGVKSTGRVIVGRGGRADCTIDAGTVVIGGVFRGTIYASEKVIGLSTAIIIGNIYSPRIIAESGLLLDGAMHIRGANGRPLESSGAQREAADAVLSSPSPPPNRKARRGRGRRATRSVGRGS
jgi:cytoskeletal protein CcmA (bactofilin family)